MATTMKTIETDQVVDRFLAAIEAGGMPATDLFALDAVLDATVPNWRFAVSGGEAVRTELARWYADSGVLEDVSRTPLPNGALVTFTLRWEEGRRPSRRPPGARAHDRGRPHSARPSVVRRSLAGCLAGRDGRNRRCVKSH